MEYTTNYGSRNPDAQNSFHANDYDKAVNRTHNFCDFQNSFFVPSFARSSYDHYLCQTYPCFRCNLHSSGYRRGAYTDNFRSGGTHYTHFFGRKSRGHFPGGQTVQKPLSNYPWLV